MKVYLPNCLKYCDAGTNVIWEGCRSFSTTPSSPLFRAVAGVSRPCVHVSHSGHYIRGVGCCWKIIIVATAPLLTLLLFERGKQPFCLSPKQNIYDRFAHKFPCVQMFLRVCTHSSHIFTPVSATQRYLRFIYLLVEHNPTFQGVGCPCPPPSTKCV